MYSDIFIIHFSGIKSRNRSYILVKIHYFLFLSAILYSIMMKFIRFSGKIMKVAKHCPADAGCFLWLFQLINHSFFFLVLHAFVHLKNRLFIPAIQKIIINPGAALRIYIIPIRRHHAAHHGAF